jgi:diphosphomevalonate decarboxylase
MWASRPPVVYWNPATVSCLETLRVLQREGLQVFFTIDAGPQVKAVATADAADRVETALRNTAGVIRTLRSAIGPGAGLVAGA